MAQQEGGAEMPRLPSGRWRMPLRYEIRSIIGTGAYGTVAEAFDHDERRLVAVKRQADIFRDTVNCKRILRELAILRQLDHDNVVRIYDVIEPEDLTTFGELYYAMEICDSDLKKVLQTDVTLEALAINTLLYNLLAGLKYLHGCGIYHRDLKPANCLVNQDCSLKIADFGLACTVVGVEFSGMQDAHLAALPGTAQAKRNLTGHVVTRMYRAPEVILLQENYTEAIDVWSAGCIYAELLQMLEGGPDYQHRGPLFPGLSCYPLSPRDPRRSGDYSYHSKCEFEQLNKIFNILGTPSESDMEELETASSRRYVQLFEERRGSGLRSRLPQAPPQSLELLEKALRFSPRQRLTVDAALEHELFLAVGLRDPAREVAASKQVTLPFEGEANLDKPLLRRYFVEEIRNFHPCGGPSGSLAEGSYGENESEHSSIRGHVGGPLRRLASSARRAATRGGHASSSRRRRNRFC
mmetsp:Transcript_75312/g.161358  ORF Transcript_75312/g.161358 Transcript_75312/m.161358 type:complete len:467 (+) Transcript_75312:78-1478(+)